MSGHIQAPVGPSAVVPVPQKEGTKTHDAKHSKDLALAAREFEQIFVRAMLKTTPIAGKGDVYGDLAVDAMAKSVTAGKGLGLGDLIRRAIEKSDHPLKVTK